MLLGYCEGIRIAVSLATVVRVRRHNRRLLQRYSQLTGRRFDDGLEAATRVEDVLTIAEDEMIAAALSWVRD